MKLVLRSLLVLMLAAPVIHPAAAQSLDPGFAPPTVYNPATVYSTIEQADGKILVTGSITRQDGTPTPAQLLRYLPSGALDAAFQQNLGATSRIYRTRTLSSGKLLLIADPTQPLTAAGLTRNGLLRLNADGTADPSLDMGSGPDVLLDDALELPNGQLLVVGYFDALNGSPVHHIARLNANGTRDASFGPGAGPNAEVLTVVRLASGKLLIGGFFTTYDGVACNGLARLNADGSYDASFATILQNNSQITNIIEQPDGKLLIAGYMQFPTGSPAAYKGVVRLLPDGNVDASFSAPNTLGSGSAASYYGDIMQRQADGKLLVGYGSTSTGGLVRLNTDGSLDNTFQAGSGPNSKPNSLTLLSTGKLLVAGSFTSFGSVQDRTLVRLTSTGALDAAWQPKLQAPGSLTSIVRQASGQIVVGGTFSEINGQTARRLARFQPDGTFDATFGANTAGGLPWTALQVVQQPDGRLVARTAFALYRFQADGTPDPSLNVSGLNLANPLQILPQPDGKLLLVGQFPGSPSATVTAVRLEANGTRDNSFSLALPANQALLFPYALALQPDGKFLLFSGVSGTRSVLRFTPTGALDASFASTPLSAYGNVAALTVQPDGKVLVGGTFTTVGGAARANLARLNSDGTLDAGFTPPNLSAGIQTLVVQPNSRILVGGQFSAAGLPGNLARLLPTGAADASFAATAVPNNTVRTIVVQPDGNLLIGGGFTTVGGQPSAALARLTASNVLHTTLPQAVTDRTQAWPVPAHSTLNVSLDPAAGARSLELLDVLGRTVRQQSLGAAPATTLGLTGLPAGAYLLRVQYAGGTVVRRVELQ